MHTCHLCCVMCSDCTCENVAVRQVYIYRTLPLGWRVSLPSQVRPGSPVLYSHERQRDLMFGHSYVPLSWWSSSPSLASTTLFGPCCTRRASARSASPPRAFSESRQDPTINSCNLSTFTSLTAPFQHLGSQVDGVACAPLTSPTRRKGDVSFTFAFLRRNKILWRASDTAHAPTASRQFSSLLRSQGFPSLVGNLTYRWLLRDSLSLLRPLWSAVIE